MLLRMTTATSLDERRRSPEVHASRTRRPALLATSSVTVLDGGAPRGALSGAVRHALELHGALTRAQRLALVAPATLPRTYSAAETALLVDALGAAGAQVSVRPGLARV